MSLQDPLDQALSSWIFSHLYVHQALHQSDRTSISQKARLIQVPPEFRTSEIDAGRLISGVDPTHIPQTPEFMTTAQTLKF